MAQPDHDVAIAVIDVWDADVDLAASVPGGLHQGRQVSGLDMPYAVLDVRPGRDAEYSTGGFYIDYREVELTVYGLYDDVQAALSDVLAAFDPQPDASVVLIIPNATFMHCWPRSREVVEDDATKDGESIWRASAVYEVMSSRAWGT